MWVKYVDQEHYKNIINFKYNGTCNSILYEYVLSDWAQFIVNHMPTWLAPNVITLISLIFMLSSYILAIIHNPDFDTPLPNWVCYYIAFSIFVYQTLDNCDGKQARRIGASTALGMLLDHGTDCLSTWIVALLLANALVIPQGISMFMAALFSGKISFFFGVYQQYHTGQFLLDRINAVDEGLPFIQIIFIISGYFGPQFWQQDFGFLGLKYHHGMIIFALVGGFITAGSFSVTVFRKMNWNPIQIISSLTLPLTLALVYFVIAFLSPTEIVNQYMHIYVLVLGFQWSKMINLWQLCLISKQQFHQFHFSWYIILGLITGNILSFYILGQCLMDEGQLAEWLLIYSFLSYAHTVGSIIIQLCDILKINFLSIKKK